jgi:hypothetical protein
MRPAFGLWRNSRTFPSREDRPCSDAEGPEGRFRSASTLALGVWKFSRNVELAKDLIRHLLSPANYARQVEASMGYNQPFLRKLGSTCVLGAMSRFSGFTNP